MGQMMWIVNRNKYIDGPLEYYQLQYYSSGYIMLGDAAQNLAIFLSDVLLIYRCYVILGSSLWIIIPLTLSSIVAFALSMVDIPIGFLLDGAAYYNLFNGIVSAGAALTTFTNVMATAMISFRILTVLYSVRKSVDLQGAKVYIGVVAILVESAAPCAVLGIIYAIWSPLPLPAPVIWSEALFPVWSMFLALFPQLIILRIAQGNAWTRTTSKELTRATESIDFVPCESAHANVSDMLPEANTTEGLGAHSSQHGAAVSIGNGGMVLDSNLG